MSYALSFFAVDLDDFNQSLKTLGKQHGDIHDILSAALDEHGEYLGEIGHPTGAGALFDKYIKTIAADCFDQPDLHRWLLRRKDGLPLPDNDMEMGYLKRSEIAAMAAACKDKDTEAYFIDNDDFEGDLEMLQDIFDEAMDMNKDIFTLYE